MFYFILKFKFCKYDIFFNLKPKQYLLLNFLFDLTSINIKYHCKCDNATR